MLVYGDPSFTASPAEIRAAFARLAAARSLDAARDLLILCGEVEQAIADTGRNDEEARCATDNAADAFLALHAGEAVSAWEPFVPETSLRIKVPEGFAFYSLLPEQYLKATEAWLRQNAESCRTLVVGLRSIGTSLSALVAARLRRGGKNPKRITVRPGGHPFRREVSIQMPERFEHAIVVDEGPGLSGSSIASVITALRAGGAGDVTIFPGHDQPPGSAASEELRDLWANTPKTVFRGFGDLQEKLRWRTEELLNSSVVTSHDLSGGQWRLLLPDCARLPAMPQMERAKFLFRAANGRALLWKFSGLGLGPGGWTLSEQALHRQRRLARMGWCQLPVEISSGFIATDWVDARPATKADLNLHRARAVARYLLDSSKVSGIHRENFERLREMTLYNVEEAFGPEARNRAASIASAATAPEELPSYGDGRIAPHEWLISGERLIKTDVWGHDLDHTTVGEQSILWDIAGTLIEWEINGSAESAFRGELNTAGLSWCEATLRFYKLAYFAFHLGIATMFGQPRERYVQAIQLPISE